MWPKLLTTLTKGSSASDHTLLPSFPTPSLITESSKASVKIDSEANGSSISRAPCCNPFPKDAFKEMASFFPYAIELKIAWIGLIKVS